MTPRRPTTTPPAYIPLLLLLLFPHHDIIGAEGNTRARARALLRQARTAKTSADALARLRDAARISPDFPAVHVALAKRLDRHGKEEAAAAADAWARASALQPGRASHWTGLGQARYAQATQQSRIAASDAFSRALMLSPVNVAARSGRALALLAQPSRARDALADLDVAVNETAKQQQHQQKQARGVSLLQALQMRVFARMLVDARAPQGFADRRELTSLFARQLRVDIAHGWDPGEEVVWHGEIPGGGAGLISRINDATVIWTTKAAAPMVLHGRTVRLGARDFLPRVEFFRRSIEAPTVDAALALPVPPLRGQDLHLVLVHTTNALSFFHTVLESAARFLAVRPYFDSGAAVLMPPASARRGFNAPQFVAQAAEALGMRVHAWPWQHEDGGDGLPPGVTAARFAQLHVADVESGNTHVEEALSSMQSCPAGGSGAASSSCSPQPAAPSLWDTFLPPPALLRQLRDVYVTGAGKSFSSGGSSSDDAGSRGQYHHHVRASPERSLHTVVVAYARRNPSSPRGMDAKSDALLMAVMADACRNVAGVATDVAAAAAAAGSSAEMLAQQQDNGGRRKMPTCNCAVMVERRKAPLMDAIAAFKSVDVIIGPHGSGLFNMMFLDPDHARTGTVIEFPVAPDQNPHARLVAEALGVAHLKSKLLTSYYEGFFENITAAAAEEVGSMLVQALHRSCAAREAVVEGMR